MTFGTGPPSLVGKHLANEWATKSHPANLTCGPDRCACRIVVCIVVVVVMVVAAAAAAIGWNVQLEM